MHRLGWVSFFLVLATAGWAASSLEHARVAQSLLPPDTWSQVLRIENTASDEVYPDEVYALAFEFSGLLWFYTDADGTQSLSLAWGQLELEKQEMSRLLLAIHPGFVRYAVVDGPASAVDAEAVAALPNGCFLRSWAELHHRVAQGEPITRARLLSYYYTARGRRWGHTVLVYDTHEGLFAVDPFESGATRRVKERLGASPVEFARQLNPPGPLIDARWLHAALPGHARVAASTNGRGASRSDVRGRG